MRYVLIFFALLLFYCAIIQLNDPDPIYWALAYGLSATIVLGKGIGRFNRYFATAVFGGIIAGLLIAAPGFADYLVAGNFSSIFGGMTNLPYVEPAREFLGLMLTSFILVWCISF